MGDMADMVNDDTPEEWPFQERLNEDQKEEDGWWIDLSHIQKKGD
jgi:hypothetical protein